MRTVTCLFYAVATLELAHLSNSGGAGYDPLAFWAALIFIGAGVGFAVLDWTGATARQGPESSSPKGGA